MRTNSLAVFAVFAALTLAGETLSRAHTPPGIQWQHSFGGGNSDECTVIKQTSDGGYVLGGYSHSGVSGNKTSADYGISDYWVVKINGSGTKSWDKSFGGTQHDLLQSLQPTSDGGYILGGSSESGVSGNKTTDSYGAADYWVVKINGSGTRIWERSFGGSSGDMLYSLRQTSDGGYILGGSSESGISGNKTNAGYGMSDFWVVKLDGSGNKIWEKSLGGADDDSLHSLQQTSDGGYILGGTSFSGVSGNKTSTNYGTYDYWVVKLDGNGKKVWENSFGGRDYDLLQSLQQTSDGGYILGGTSESGIAGNKTTANYGSSDYWMVKLDGSGNKVWEKSFGGDSYDSLRSLQQTSDGGYILGGCSYSDVSGNKTSAHYGISDYWVLKLDGSGNKIWEKAMGGGDDDSLHGLQQTSDGGYIVGGVSRSAVSGNKTSANYGNYDYWAVKIAPPPLPPSAPKILKATPLSSSVVSLQWTNTATNVSAFVIWRGASSNLTTLKVGTVSGTVRAFTNSGLTASTTYFYSVQATNAGGVSAKSGAMGVKTFGPPPPAPNGLTATAFSPNRVNLSWRKTSTNVTGFTIFRGTVSGGPYSVVTYLSFAKTNYLDNTVHSGLRYYYVLKAYNSGGSSTNSSQASVTLPVGLTDNFIFQNTNGQFSIWVMNQTNFVGYSSITNGLAPKNGWRIAALPDLNSDYNADILWQHNNGQLVTWLMRGTNFLRSVPLKTGPVAGTGWKIVDAPDLTGDGKPDFLWHHIKGTNMYWKMNGTNFVSQHNLRIGYGTSTGWNVIGTADLDSNLSADLIWNHTNGWNAVWLMSRTNYSRSVPLRTGYTAASGWKLASFMDLNADRKTDFIWEKNDGQLQAWLMNGTNFLRSVTLKTNAAASSGWRLVGPK